MAPPTINPSRSSSHQTKGMQRLAVVINPTLVVHKQKGRSHAQPTISNSGSDTKENQAQVSRLELLAPQDAHFIKPLLSRTGGIADLSNIKELM